MPDFVLNGDLLSDFPINDPTRDQTGGKQYLQPTKPVRSTEGKGQDEDQILAVGGYIQQVATNSSSVMHRITTVNGIG